MLTEMHVVKNNENYFYFTCLFFFHFSLFRYYYFLLFFFFIYTLLFSFSWRVSTKEFWIRSIRLTKASLYLYKLFSISFYTTWITIIYKHRMCVLIFFFYIYLIFFSSFTYQNMHLCLYNILWSVFLVLIHDFFVYRVCLGALTWRQGRL